MFWSPTNFKEFKQLLPTFLRKPMELGLLNCFLTPVDELHKSTLYKMQHDGRTIYLEKVLNEYFKVNSYLPTDHENTKTVYIEDIDNSNGIYIHQDNEIPSVFLKDEPDVVDDLFIEVDGEDNLISYSFTINIPAAYEFNEAKVRALVDAYRYFGKKYIIQTY